MSEIKISLENIGGITKERTFIIKQGLNVVRAPNAVGKSSFVHGIQTLILPNDELSEHTEFLNDFASSVNPGLVQLIIDGKTFERKLRKGGERLNIVGDPFYQDGTKANLLTVAVPENEFLDMVTKGQTLTKFFENFSDIGSYQDLIDWSDDKIRETLMELDRQREDITELKNLRSINEKAERELKTLESEKDKIQPIYDKIKKEKWDKKLEEIGKLNERRRSISSKIADLNERKKVRERQIPILTREIERLEKEIENFNKKYPDVERHIDKLDKSLMEKRRIRENIELELDEIEKQIKAISYVYDEIILEGRDTCPVCGRPLSKADREKHERELEAKRLKGKKELIEVDAEVKKLELERKSLIDERDRILFGYTKERDERNGTLTQCEREVKDFDKELNRLVPDEKEVFSKIAEIEKQLDPKTREVLKQYDEVILNIQKNENMLKLVQEQIDEKSDSEKVAERLQNKVEFLKRAKTHINERKMQIKDAVRQKFNERIMEVYNLLGFKNFENIEIDDSDAIRVVRKFEGRTITQELNRLSTSERYTIGIIVMLAGKEEFLQDFQFFILDEIITSYDPTRFEKIISYIQKHVQYVIVTALTPSGDLRVEYKL